MSAPLALPSILYGPFAEVRRRVSAAVRRFAAGEPWDEALAADATVSPRDAPGLIVLSGPAPMLADEPHFHPFLPLSLVLEGVRRGKMEESRRDDAARESLATPWGLLGVLAPVNQLLVYAPAVHRPTLRAAVRFWETLDSAGARYTVGLRDGARLWDVPNNLHYVLAQAGLGTARLRAPLPPGGLQAIVPEEAG